MNKQKNYLVNKMQNSWYLKKDDVHHFFCKCGQQNIICNLIEKNSTNFEVLNFKKEEIDFNEIPNLFHPDNICKFCQNEKFLDVNALLFDDKTRYWSNIEWDYESCSDGNSWKVTSFLDIPKHSFLKQNIIKRHKLSSYMMNQNGDIYYEEKDKGFGRKFLMINGKDYRIDKLLKKEITHKLIKFMIANPSNSIEWLKGEVKTIEGLIFFLHNDSIRFVDALNWKNIDYFLEALNRYQYLKPCLTYILNHRAEKSLRKAHFISYEKMMSTNGYNPMADYVFSRSINDVNHLCTLINMDIEIKQKLFNDCNLVNLFHFIEFLNKQYETKYIVKFWLSITHEDLSHYLLRDSCRMLENRVLRNELNERFNKTAFNLQNIHDQFTQYSQSFELINIKNKSFHYDDTLISSQVIKENIEYKLPMDYKTLYNWGVLLHNCASSYFQYIENGRSIIWGLFVEKELTYLIEIQENKIVQASAKYNKSLPTDERKKVDRWHKEVYLKNILKKID